MLLDIFCGPGGWDIAARDLGLEVIGVEINSDVVRTRAAAKLRTIHQDVRYYEPTEKFDGLIASPPCPDFSVGGTHQGEHGPTGSLIHQIPRFVNLIQPEWIACEQVPKVLPYWEQFAQQLQKVGYHTWTGILDAYDYGVPQNRRRAILLASHKKKIGMPHTGEHKNVAEALGWDPSTIFGFPRRADRKKTIIIDGKSYRARDLRTANKPAFTLTEKARSWSVWDPHRRPLTLTEGAILQTFPPNYPFAGSRTSQFHQLADAIPPTLAKQLLTTVISNIRTNKDSTVHNVHNLRTPRASRSPQSHSYDANVHRPGSYKCQ